MYNYSRHFEWNRWKSFFFSFSLKKYAFGKHLNSFAFHKSNMARDSKNSFLAYIFFNTIRFDDFPHTSVFLSRNSSQRFEYFPNTLVNRMQQAHEHKCFFFFVNYAINDDGTSGLFFFIPRTIESVWTKMAFLLKPIRLRRCSEIRFFLLCFSARILRRRKSAFTGFSGPRA